MQTTNVSLEQQHRLLNIYDKYMHLKIFVSEVTLITKQLYIDAARAHNERVFNDPMHIDAGFDVFSNPIPDSVKNRVYTFDFKITCSAKMICDSGKQYSTGYYMYPRSSLSKTTWRLANSTGIIDAGYRGHLMGKFDTTAQYPLLTKNEQKQTNVENLCQDVVYPRLVQICAPGLVPIYVEIVDDISKLGEKTVRDSGGFGSTGI
jgi:dUTP pyrophosphatase